MFPLWVKLRVAIPSFRCQEDEVYQLLERCVLEALTLWNTGTLEGLQ